MTVDIKVSAAVSLNFDKVQGLRDLEDNVLSLSAYCKAGSKVIEALQGAPGADFQGMWSLEPFNARLQGYAENLLVLTKRISNTIELVSAARRNGVLRLIENVVCICARFEESVHCCRYQRPRFPTC